MLASELPLSRLLDALQELTQGMDDYEQRSLVLEAANRLAAVDAVAVEFDFDRLVRPSAVPVKHYVGRLFDALNGKLRSVGEGVR